MARIWNLARNPRHLALPLAVAVTLVTPRRAVAETDHVTPAFTLNSSEETTEAPASMGALGDSISAGMLANFSRKNANLPWVETWFVLRSLVAGSLFQMKGLEKKSLAWSAGYNPAGKVLSHAHRLAALNVDRDLRVYNAAHSGDTVLDVLDTQMPALSAWSQQKLGQKYPDYVALLIGANDLCADSTAEMTPVSDYYSRLERTLSDLVQQSPNTKVMIAKIPNVERLRSVALGQRLWGWGLLNKCEDAWKAIKLCHTLTTESDPVERAKVVRAMEDYNLIIDDVATKINARYGDRIRVSQEVYDIRFTADHLSMDCFHPNPEGQRVLSAESWKSTWWSPQFTEREDAELLSRLKMNTRCDGELTRERSSIGGGRGGGTAYSMSSACRRWFRKPASERATGHINFDN